MPLSTHLMHLIKSRRLKSLLHHGFFTLAVMEPGLRSVPGC